VSIGPWTFTGFDIVVLLVIIISLLMAASRGLFRELISIAALVMGAVAGLFAYGRFRFEARDLISPNWLADGALALGTFAIIYMIMVFLFSGMVKNLRGKSVGFLDRLMGAAFGVARGLLVCALAAMVFTASYREAKAAQEFRDEMQSNGTAITEEMLEKAPKSIQDAFLDREPELPKVFQGSTFFPLLERIGDGIRALPFSRMETLADRLKKGEDLGKIAEELNNL
jgi:membrane protein required for colicin V production